MIRNVLAGALLAAGAFTSLAGVASAECEPFPLFSEFCEGSLPGADDIPDIRTDIQCSHDPETGEISCD